MLPPELIDYIFSFLRKDTLALKACSEAHPLYSRLSERHLYTDIVVDPPGVSELYKQFSENSRFLDYPRALEIRRGPFENQLILSIMAMIPRMANLISLTICERPCSFDHNEEFISTFRNCLQQSSIEKLYLSDLADFSFSVLDNGKNIKKLMLSDCNLEAAEETHFELTLISGSRDAHNLR